jgi:2-polyprenyl-3-methyl-5-hydroxy-6-metoxy-1,4-benzoquinol methylase
VSEYSQLDMVHRLPPARLVDRFEHLAGLATGRRVVHAGFVDAGCQTMNEDADAWLHEHLAATAREIVGIDVDPGGVERARARGYDAHEVDCRDAAAVRALGLGPADLVVAGEVIEHLDDCGPFLDGLHALVDPGGLLAVSTPNGASLTNAVAALANLEVNHPDHVTSFTSHTLDTMLRRHRWEPVEHAVFTYQVKSRADGSLRSRVLVHGARGILGIERFLARAGRPYLAGGLIVVARATG